MYNLLLALAGISLGFAFSLLGTKYLIPFLNKMQFKQFVREEGPESHLKKTGTPSMGGIAIIGATIVASVITGLVTGGFTVGLVATVLAMILFGLIGFIDDYNKAIKKNNAGISPIQKIVLQVAFSLAFAVFAYNFSGIYLTQGYAGTIPSVIWIPFGDIYLDLGIFYIPYVMFVMIAFSNSVNLTDGMDGLASGITAIVSVAMFFIVISHSYFDQPVVFVAVAGACLGFLFFNHYPAKIFMGDTGSMALGGVLSAAAILTKCEFILAVCGLIYVLEALSVIIQVGYFKVSHGKRIFRMAPLHHHFEEGGMAEQKVVIMFWLFALVCSIIGALIGIL